MFKSFITVAFCQASLQYIVIRIVKSIIVLIVFTSLVHIFFNKSGGTSIEPLFLWIYSGAIRILLITVRFILVVMVMVVFMATTSPSQITHAIEKSLDFLR